MKARPLALIAAMLLAGAALTAGCHPLIPLAFILALGVEMVYVERNRERLEDEMRDESDPWE